MESFSKLTQILVFGVNLGFVLGEDKSIFVDLRIEALDWVDILYVLQGLLDSVLYLELL